MQREKEKYSRGWKDKTRNEVIAFMRKEINIFYITFKTASCDGHSEISAWEETGKRVKEKKNVKINKQFQKSLELGWRFMFSRANWNVFGVLRKA